MLKNLGRVLVGLLLIPLWHLPRLIGYLLLLSYAAVFQNVPTLTASPAEHLARARRVLRSGRLSELLYVALEIRFALERMTRRELLFAEMASTRMLKEYDPVKHLANLHRLAADAAYAHEVFLVNKATGERHRLAEYRTLDRARVTEIQGRLGDLLHTKEGLLLGVPSDPWYLETRRFLTEAAGYLAGVAKNNAAFFSYHGLEQFEMLRSE